MHFGLEWYIETLHDQSPIVLTLVQFILTLSGKALSIPWNSRGQCISPGFCKEATCFKKTCEAFPILYSIPRISGMNLSGKSSSLLFYQKSDERGWRDSDFAGGQHLCSTNSFVLIGNHWAFMLKTSPTILKFCHWWDARECIHDLQNSKQGNEQTLYMRVKAIIYPPRSGPRVSFSWPRTYYFDHGLAWDTLDNDIVIPLNKSGFQKESQQIAHSNWDFLMTVVIKMRSLSIWHTCNFTTEPYEYTNDVALYSKHLGWN